MQYAKDVPAWNRYETYLFNRLEQPVSLWQETRLKSGGIWADVSHMNPVAASRNAPAGAGLRFVRGGLGGTVPA